MVKIILNCHADPIMFYDKKLILLFSTCYNNQCLLSTKSQNQLKVYLFCYLNGFIYAQDNFMIICYNLCIYFEKLL